MEQNSKDPRQERLDKWALRGALAVGILLLVASLSIFAIAGFSDGWRRPLDVLFGGLPAIESGALGALLAARKGVAAAVFVWVAALLNAVVIYSGALGVF